MKPDLLSIRINIPHLINVSTSIPTVLFLTSIFFLTEAATIKIATYNILNFPDAQGMQRIDDFRLIMEYYHPDILVVQEMQSQTGQDIFLDSILNYYGEEYEAVPFHDGPDTDNAIFYRSGSMENIDCIYIPTQNRDIAEYTMLLSDSHTEFYIYSLHFKSSTGAGNEQSRYQEATILRNHLDSLPLKSCFLVTGDFNIYHANEPAYQKLVSDVGPGRLYDPIAQTGSWHDNSDFTSIHSQSTRDSELPDGGASGGMDDRFDMVLCSSSFLDSTGLFLLRNSYQTIGNDGNHFNKSINDGYNSAVPAYIADALYYASDHVPVMVTITDEHEAMPDRSAIAMWPNPMKTQVQIQFPFYEDFEQASVTLTNILGQRVYQTTCFNPVGVTIQRQDLPVGVYFVKVRITTSYQIHEHKAKLAMIKQIR